MIDSWHMLDTWIVVVGALAAMACALPGNFLVLQRMSLMGDAISHAVLPGLAVAFLVTGSRASAPMFVGAAGVGVLTAVLTQWIHTRGRVEPGAAMGVVFTALFAAGLVLIVRGADHVDLDPDCVLYGAIETVWAGEGAPGAVYVLGGALVLNGLFTIVFYKELKICSFDPSLATTLGISARGMHYALMTLVAVTTVAAFEAVGSILVIAMLIVPAATAYLLTDRLHLMIILSLVVAVASAVLGHVAAITVPAWFGGTDTSTAGMMATMAGALFAIAMVAAPRHGVVNKVFHRALLRLRIVEEDVLGLLYRLEEMPDQVRPASAPSFVASAIQSGPVWARWALARLRRKGKIVWGPAGYGLADSGRTEAQRLVRTHRLWESYLHTFLKLPADHVHATAERLEHVTTPAMRERLADKTGQPDRDPQGKQVPPA